MKGRPVPQPGRTRQAHAASAASDVCHTLPLPCAKGVSWCPALMLIVMCVVLQAMTPREPACPRRWTRRSTAWSSSTLWGPSSWSTRCGCLSLHPLAGRLLQGPHTSAWGGGVQLLTCCCNGVCFAGGGPRFWLRARGTGWQERQHPHASAVQRPPRLLPEQLPHHRQRQDPQLGAQRRRAEEGGHSGWLQHEAHTASACPYRSMLRRRVAGQHALLASKGC